MVDCKFNLLFKKLVLTCFLLVHLRMFSTVWDYDSIQNPDWYPYYRQSHLRTSDYPFISTDTFRSIANHKIDGCFERFDTSNVKPGDIIFTSFSGRIKELFDLINKEIKVPIIIILSESDGVFDENWFKYLNPSKFVHKIYVTNLAMAHPKVHPIPIGVAAKGKYFSSPVIFLNEIIHKNIKKKLFPIYCNFHIGDFSILNERVRAFHYFKNSNFSFFDSRRNYSEYLYAIKQHTFIASPPGAGPDCYRHWEALTVGSYPVILRTGLHEFLFSDLPVILVNDWSEVTPVFLRKKLKEFKKTKFNLEKVHADFWINLILEEQNKLKELQAVLKN